MGEARAAYSAMGGWHEDRHQRPQTPVEDVRQRPSKRRTVIRRRNSSSADEMHNTFSSSSQARHNSGAERTPHSSSPEAGPSTSRSLACEPSRRLDGQAAFRLLLDRARRVVSLSSDGEQGERGERARLLHKRLPATPPEVPTKTTLSSSDDEVVPVLFHTAQSYVPRTRATVRGVFKNGDSDTDSYEAETIRTPPPRPPGRAALRGEDSGDDDTVPVALRAVLRAAINSPPSMASDDEDEPEPEPKPEPAFQPSVLLPRPVAPGSPPTVRVRLRSKTPSVSPKPEPACALPLDGAAILAAE